MQTMRASDQKHNIKRRRPWPRKLRDEIYRRACAGESPYLLARETGVPRGTIVAWVSKGAAMSHRNPNLHVADVEEDEEGDKTVLLKTPLPPPPGAEVYYNGLYYKRGVHGKVFYWNNEWRLSTVRHSEIDWNSRRRTW